MAIYIGINLSPNDIYAGHILCSKCGKHIKSNGHENVMRCAVHHIRSIGMLHSQFG